jgi:hypothetical protein
MILRCLVWGLWKSFKCQVTTGSVIIQKQFATITALKSSISK